MLIPPAWRIMNIYQNNSYSNQTIDLDNNAFRGCVFEDCLLRFSAVGPTELSGCDFSRSRLEAAGAAKLTLGYLRAFYQGLGEWGRGTVEQMFEVIRAGAPARAPANAPTVPRGAAVAADFQTAAYGAKLSRFGATPEGEAIVRGFEHLSAEQRRQIAELIGRAVRAAA